jgi:beta-phosphoglucomutase
MFKGFLFDFDGTLGKTMEDHFIAWRDTLRDYEIHVTENDYYPLEGMSMELIVRKLYKKDHLSNEDINSIIFKKKQKFILNNKFQFYPGVEDLINKLLNNSKIGIVTSSHSDQMQAVVPQNFLNKFDFIVYGDKVKNGKPYSEPYTTGVAGLNLKARECVAIENAPLGITSAKSAGLYCIGVCSTLGPEFLKSADELVSNFADLQSLQAFSKR